MNEISDDLAEQVRAAVDQASFTGTSLLGLPSLNLGDAKGKVITGIDTVTGALDLILQYAWLIPDQYETPLRGLDSALKKVKGWIP